MDIGSVKIIMAYWFINNINVHCVVEIPCLKLNWSWEVHNKIFSLIEKIQSRTLPIMLHTALVLSCMVSIEWRWYNA